MGHSLSAEDIEAIRDGVAKLCAQFVQLQATVDQSLPRLIDTARRTEPLHLPLGDTYQSVSRPSTPASFQPTRPDQLHSLIESISANLRSASRACGRMHAKNLADQAAIAARKGRIPIPSVVERSPGSGLFSQ